MCVLGVGIVFGFAAAAGQPSGDDSFGYTAQPQPFNWVDTTITGTLATFPSSGNSFTSPIPIGFSFPFYENDYGELYISTNGLASFGQGTLVPINTTIPFTLPPNDFIAPFWADLDVGGVNSGEVYYQLRGNAPDRFFVIAFVNVTDVSTPSEPLNFEMLLYENGDICMQFAAMAGDLGSATIGIEDPDGYTGVNLSGTIAQDSAYCLFRPPPSARVKLLPKASSGFLANRNALFPLTVKNTGDLGTDNYSLSYQSSVPGWTATFSQGGTPAGNPVLLDETGPVPENAAAVIDLAVTAPETASVGESAVITVTAASQLDPSVQIQSVVIAAIPSSFAHIFLDSQSGLQLQMFSDNAQILTGNLAPGAASGLSMALSNSREYFVFWEHVYLNAAGKSVVDLEYRTVNQAGIPALSSQSLTFNNSVLLPTFDRQLSAEANGLGQMGVIFIRDVIDDTVNPVEINSNIYFAVLNSDASLAIGPVNLTQNAQFRAPSDVDVPFFRTPRITSSGANFAVTWIENRLQAGAIQEDDVRIGILNSTGSFLFGPVTQADSTPGGNLYFNPIIQGLAGGRYLLAYGTTDPSGNPLNIQYAVRDAAGNIIFPEETLANAAGSGLDAVELSGGNLLLAWIDVVSDQLHYAVLSPAYNVLFGPSELPAPAGRVSANPSVTRDASGRGIVIWMDGTGAKNLYYAFVEPDGAVLTSPIVIRSTESTNAFLLASSNGGGNAAFVQSYSLYLPQVNR